MTSSYFVWSKERDLSEGNHYSPALLIEAEDASGAARTFARDRGLAHGTPVYVVPFEAAREVAVRVELVPCAMH